MGDDDPKRWLWIEEIAQGPFSVAQMYKMAKSGEIVPTTLFWSEAKQKWLPLACVMFDIEPSRLSEMAAAGVERVEILGSGQVDCLICSGLVGKFYLIVASPVLPPPDCTCVPWCRLLIIATKAPVNPVSS